MPWFVIRTARPVMISLNPAGQGPSRWLASDVAGRGSWLTLVELRGSAASCGHFHDGLVSFVGDSGFPSSFRCRALVVEVGGWGPAVLRGWM
jgi:hypothetical protein